MSEPRLALKNSGGSQRIVKARRTNEPDDIEMANLYPRDTGLPMTVWVSPRRRARHDARVKVCLTPGDRMDSTNTAVVAIRPVPRVVSGALPRREFVLVSQWITDNRAALLAYWDGKLSTVEFAIQMRPLPNAALHGKSERRRPLGGGSRSGCLYTTRNRIRDAGSRPFDMVPALPPRTFPEPGSTPANVSKIDLRAALSPFGLRDYCWARLDEYTHRTRPRIARQYGRWCDY